ncbi:major capsid protein [Mycobacterium numidiamassiliense]|uniref:Major capsid protein n=1 Tax=Mycobacterium numidiamassiliense TaxID=1841861 RepID=A0A2U3PI54_9MYCO|nr:phage major capsid protein [Mycobacterium numidiamassiliense]SPM43345.1 major capsid protein [Mycobacterium numidiamassiliense]
MALTSGVSSGAGILSAEEVGILVVQPLRLRSVGLRVSTVVETMRPTYRFPIVESDATAALVQEGSEITESEADLGQISVTPVGIKALTTVSNELIADAAENAAAAAVIADGLVRSFARKYDKCFFGAVSNFDGTSAPAMSGLENVAYQAVNVGAPYSNLDPFAKAISLIESVGSVCTSFAASFSTCLSLMELKKFGATTDVVSNEPLLAQGEGDVSQPVSRNIFGVPLYSAPEGTIEDGVVWALASDKTFTVMRMDISIVANPFSAFSSDSTQIRGVMRLAPGFPHAAAVVKITGAVPGS